MPITSEQFFSSIQRNDPELLEGVQKTPGLSDKVGNALQSGIEPKQVLEALRRNLSNSNAQVQQIAKQPQGDIEQTQDRYIKSVDLETVPPSQLQLRAEKSQRQIAETVGAAGEFILPTVGGIAGGVIGTASPIPGGLHIGGATGALAGKRASRLLNWAVGLTEPETPIQMIHSMGSDMLESQFEELVGAGITAAGKKLLAPMAKKITGQAMKLMRQAKKLDVTLTPAQITDSELLKSSERIMRGMVLTADELKQFDLKQLKNLTAARDLAVNTALKNGKKQSAEELGKKIIGKVDSFVLANIKGGDIAKDRLRNKILRMVGSKESYHEIGNFQLSLLKKYGESIRATQKSLFDDVQKALPDGPKTLLDATKLKKTLNEFIADPQREVAVDTFTKALSQIKSPQQLPTTTVSGKSLMTFEDLDALRRKIGRSLGKSRGLKDITQDVVSGQLSKMYGAVLDTVDDFAKTVNGKSVGISLDLARSSSRDFYKFLKDPNIRKLMTTETGVDRIYSLSVNPKSTGLLKILKRNIGDDAIKKLQNRAARDIIESGTVTKMRQKIVSLGTETVEELFDPKLYKNLQDVITQIDNVEKISVSNPFFDKILAASKINPTIAVDTILKSQSTKGVDQLRKVVTTVQFNNIRSKFIESITGGAGQITAPSKIINAIENLNPTFVKKLLTKTELNFIQDFADITRVMKTVENKSSGYLFLGALGTLSVYDPITGSSIALSMRLLPKLYLSAAGRKLLTRASSNISRHAIQAASRLAIIALEDQEDRDNIDYLNNIE